MNIPHEYYEYHYHATHILQKRPSLLDYSD